MCSKDIGLCAFACRGHLFIDTALLIRISNASGTSSVFVHLFLKTVTSYYCDYVSLHNFLASSLRSYQTLKNYLYGVNVLHKCYSLSVEYVDDFNVKLVLLFARKQLCVPSNAKLPITPAMLLSFRPHLDLTLPLDAALWSSFVIAFYGFLRKVNLEELY